MFDVEGFILVGGASSRMGRDKAQLVFDGTTALERIAGQLSAATSAIRLVGARLELRTPGLENVPDVEEGWGALGGIHAALRACSKPWALIVACDLPFVSARLFEHLCSLIGDERDAIAPIQKDGRPQPLCALYRVATCLPETEALIESGEHTPRALLAKARTRWVPFSEIAGLEGASNFFFNMNTLSDFELAKKLLSER